MSWGAQVSTTSCRSRFAEAVGAVSRRSAALAVYFGQSAGRRVCLKRVRENHARAGSCMLINICVCFLQSGSAPLRLQLYHSRGVFGNLPLAPKLKAREAGRDQLWKWLCFNSRRRPMPQCRKVKFRTPSGCIVSDRDGQRPTDETDKHAP